MCLASERGRVGEEAISHDEGMRVLPHQHRPAAAAAASAAAATTAAAASATAAAAHPVAPTCWLHTRTRWSPEARDHVSTHHRGAHHWWTGNPWSHLPMAGQRLIRPRSTSARSRGTA